jgi:hypothetical protein
MSEDPAARTGSHQVLRGMFAKKGAAPTPGDSAEEDTGTHWRFLGFFFYVLGTFVVGTMAFMVAHAWNTTVLLFIQYKADPDRVNKQEMYIEYVNSQNQPTDTPTEWSLLEDQRRRNQTPTQTKFMNSATKWYLVYSIVLTLSTALFFALIFLALLLYHRRTKHSGS